jgi:hypothetical protein
VSVTAASLDLGNALKAARVLWLDTLNNWKDPVSREFDEHHWLPLATQTEATISALDRLAPVLVRALRDCS